MNEWVKDEVLKEFSKTYPFGVKPNDSKWPEVLMNNVMTKVESLGKKEGMEPFGCLVKHVYKPLSKTLKKHVISAMKNLQQAMNKVWRNKLKKKLEGEIRKTLNAQFAKVVNANKSEDIEQMLRFVDQSIQKHTRTQRKLVNKKLARYEELLSSKKAKQAAKIYKELDTMLKKELSANEMAKIADAIERFRMPKSTHGALDILTPFWSEL